MLILPVQAASNYYGIMYTTYNTGRFTQRSNLTTENASSQNYGRNHQELSKLYVLVFTGNVPLHRVETPAAKAFDL